MHLDTIAQRDQEQVRLVRNDIGMHQTYQIFSHLPALNPRRC